MKAFRLGLITLVFSSLALFTISCSANNTTTSTTGTSIATVKQGTILTSVIGTGNLALENKSELSFGQTGLVSQATTVKVATVNAVEGQIVEQGQILVQADTADWQVKVKSAQHSLDSAKQSMLQAQSGLESAQFNLNAQTDVKAIQDKIDSANVKMQQAQMMYDEAVRFSDTEGKTYWLKQVSKYENDIKIYQQDMTDLLADPLHSGAATSVADIRAKQRAVDQAQAQVVNAQNNVDDAQSALDDAKNSAQTITAPFKGLITKVSVNVGDIVSRSANLIEIAQPDKFIANILVTEIDVMSLNLNQNATVSFNALTGLNFPAKIIKIAPVATISQGVVNYNVTVELTSTTPVFNRPLTGQTSFPSATGGSFPTRTADPAAGQGATSTPSNSATTTLPGSSQTGQASSGSRAALNISLKDGLSATVTIIIQQKDNVLLVPNRAITRSSGVSTVQIVKGTATESRTVKPGLSDSSNTEITEGLSEGEQVVVKTSSTSNTNSFGPGGPPGGGFILR
jgi:multidrug efflux pump subunit AcrA (membrane-fusion protein)